MQAPAPDEGALIGGKYRLERVIGEGGMGTVYAACHELLDVQVAVKVLSAELTRQPGIIARFLREARAVARLKSEHVARVMDVGTYEGQPFIVMELLEGEDLDRRLQRGPLPISDACDFVLQTLEAMAHAHAIGIVHRDLKPANLFVTTPPDGREVLKVLDFGIAKLTHAVQANGARSGGLTGQQSTLGSPSYMAPEQVRALPEIDHRADLWAVGTILYELVTGRTAFGGSSVGDIFGAVLHSAVTPVRELRPDAPAGLEAVIERCLRRPVEERFADAAELAAAVAPFASGAWQGHVLRIGQTLARAGKTSDGEGARISKLGLESAALDAFGAEPGSGPRSARRPIFSPPRDSAPRVDFDLARTADELAPLRTPPPVSSSARPGRRASRALWAIPVAVVFGGGLVTALLLRSRAPVPVQPMQVSAAASPAPPPAQDVPPVETADSPAVEAPASAAASAATQPPHSAPGGVQKRTAPVKQPAAATPPSKDLPNVLRSPD